MPHTPHLSFVSAYVFACVREHHDSASYALGVKGTVGADNDYSWLEEGGYEKDESVGVDNPNGTGSRKEIRKRRQVDGEQDDGAVQLGKGRGKRQKKDGVMRGGRGGRGTGAGGRGRSKRGRTADVEIEIVPIEEQEGRGEVAGAESHVQSVDGNSLRATDLTKDGDAQVIMMLLLLLCMIIQRPPAPPPFYTSSLLS